LEEGDGVGVCGAGEGGDVFGVEAGEDQEAEEDDCVDEGEVGSVEDGGDEGLMHAQIFFCGGFVQDSLEI
jgi:hypothetical protein